MWIIPRQIAMIIHDPRCQGPVKAAEMFKVLLKDARSRDVIQSSFVALI